MMGDILKKVKSGDPLRVPAATFNTVIDAARDHFQCQQSGGAAGQGPIKYEVSEDIRQTTQGEAYTFSQMLLAAGQTAKIVGRIGHLLPMVALPSATEGAPTEVRYGWQFLA
jgi:hypothetical protein